jgi:hypothetical protein
MRCSVAHAANIGARLRIGHCLRSIPSDKEIDRSEQAPSSVLDPQHVMKAWKVPTVENLPFPHTVKGFLSACTDPPVPAKALCNLFTVDRQMNVAIEGITERFRQSLSRFPVSMHDDHRGLRRQSTDETGDFTAVGMSREGVGADGAVHLDGGIPQPQHTVFGGLFGESVVMPIQNPGKSGRFVAYGGRIPAPIHSLNN